MIGHRSVRRYRSIPSPLVPHGQTNIRQAELMLLTTGLALLAIAAMFYLDAEATTQKAVDIVRILVGTIPIMSHW